MADRPSRARLRASLPCFVGIGLLGVACGDEPRPQPSISGAVGELGNGRFVDLDCVDATEISARCPGQFPSCIALGGRVRVGYEDGSGDLLSPFTASETYFASIGGAFEARRLGSSAFIVENDDYVVDYLHLRVAEIEAFVLRRLDGRAVGNPIRLRTGSVLEIAGYPQNASCVTMGGFVSTTAESSDASVVTVSSGATSIVLEALSPGEVTLTIEIDGISQDVVVEVDDPPRRTPPPDPDTSDASSGSGSSDTGSSSGTSGSSGSSTGGTDTETDTGGGSTTGAT